MSFMDLFKAKENAQLRSRNEELESMLTPEMRDYIVLQQKTKDAEKYLQEVQSKTELEIDRRRLEVIKYTENLEEIVLKIKKAKEDLVETNETVLMQSFGLFEPVYDFANSSKYKDKLAEVRAAQKEMLKNETAATASTTWQVNGSTKEGTKMVKSIQKLLLRAFNTECDDIVAHIKFNNLEASKKRIDSSCDAISKLGAGFNISISNRYRNLKKMEVDLAYEYQVVKQREKEELKQLRAEERERAKIEKEIQEEQKKIAKEQKHYTNALAKIDKQIEAASPDELIALREKKEELKETLIALDKSMEEVDYRAANQKAGYVYIISNVGAFGENVYKIGMTRRLEPMDRIDELGDASVPFNFDVHAMIFSDNAPALETALHHAFEDRKLNMVNTRREFFRVSLDEIKEVNKKNYDKTVEFIDVPMAEQYRQSELIRKGLNAGKRV